MSLFAFKNFWCDIIWSTAYRSLSFSIELKFGSQAKITNLDLHLVVEEQVTELKISVDDTVTVQILDSGTDLVYVTLHLKLM